MVVTLDSTIEAKPLPTGTFTQKAELIAHLQALQLAAGVLSIYTDSKYTFTAAHVHRALYREKGLINSGGREIKMARKSSSC